MYSVMVKIDKDLPWIELRGDYSTRREARLAAQKAMEGIDVKIANVPPTRKTSKTLVTVRTTH